MLGAGGEGRGQDASPLNGLVLSEQLSQSLSAGSLKVVALGQEGAGCLIPHRYRLGSKCHVHTPQGPGQAADEARWPALGRRVSFQILLSLTAVGLPVQAHVCSWEHSGNHIPDLQSPPTHPRQDHQKSVWSPVCREYLQTLSLTTIQIFTLPGHSNRPPPTPLSQVVRP